MHETGKQLASSRPLASIGIAHLGLVDEDEHDDKHEDEAL